MDCDTLLKALVEAAKGAFGANLTGVYLHGSLAMGCFNPKKSDIDLLVVVETMPGRGSGWPSSPGWWNSTSWPWPRASS